MSEVGLAIVGSAGVIGRTHVSDLQNMESARLVGVHDVNTEGARTQAQEHGVRFYQTLEDVLVDPDVDAITIGTPHPLHPTIAMAAFQAGKHVLTEKPIASTLTQADEMVAAARKAGVTLGVVFQHRFRPEVNRMRELIEAGALGRLYRTILVQAAFRSQAYYETAAWRGTWGLEGGGVLLNQSVHFIDLLQWLGGMPRVVHGMASTLAHDIEVEDAASALLEYEDGGHGMVHCDTVQFPSQEQLELWGELRRPGPQERPADTPQAEGVDPGVLGEGDAGIPKAGRARGAHGGRAARYQAPGRRRGLRPSALRGEGARRARGRG